MQTDKKRLEFRVGIEAFILKDGKLLLGKRKNTVEAGSWGLIGGHLEKGEQFEACLKRELQEEIGITVTKCKLVSIDNDQHSSIAYIHIGFLVEEFKGKIKINEPEKIEDLQFFPLNNLPTPLFTFHRGQIELFKKDLLY